MENTLQGAADASVAEQSAVQNTKSAASTLRLALVWLAVSIPMLWGIMKALEDVRNLFP
jgi:hypothetical protein